jgi:hypothetical protein
MLEHYDTVVSMVLAARADTIVGVVLVVPPAATQDAFGANYGCGQTRWQYRCNQHRVVERLMEHYGGRKGHGTALVPAFVNLDCVHNYPTREAPANAATDRTLVRQSNGVHPAAAGYRQIGDTLYCWLKGMLARTRRDGGER